ncbi:heat shock 70 kDa protein PPF203-like [Frankliniella occidentalis]|uniref:Heat shock 70 kDa protein PPF203-like n=1 Tax=Frankliniella occidentalis TaxID=133901 RepID=A0A9C6UAN3_FRAOC|nr:heat shock 70 kDa protein PPF203-like [Frankliniella occidentalis]
MKTYCSVEDFQSSMKLSIYQGERSLVKDNFYLNKDITIEIPPKPVREATVDVTFEINESGLLTVTAVEPTSGRQVMVEVTPKEAHLSEADIQAMIQKASLYRCEDNEAKRKVEEELRKRGVVF